MSIPTSFSRSSTRFSPFMTIHPHYGSIDAPDHRFFLLIFILGLVSPIENQVKV